MKKQPLVKIRNATVYLGGYKILSSINWTMSASENWAVVGNNGAGKTTFMKLVFGQLIPLHGGDVHWFGNPELTPLDQIRKKIGFVSAEYQEDYRYNICGWEVVASGLFSSIGIYETISSKQKQTALEWMDFLGIGRLAQTGFKKMSYGEARRTLLARALVNRPSLLILDEPCTGLDIPTKEVFLRTLEKISATQTQVVYVTHHIDEIMPFITHLLYLKDGKIFNQGAKKDMLADEVLSEALGCPVTLKKNQNRYWITGSRALLPDQPTS
ncbi:MAG: putative ABC transporter ATP-binding protein YlmA [Nitrospinaceae bacterium]|nr:MAG: putative ABC transporter ATP-binding protein YlmA [Nitrospinaceae bacterium]